MSGRVLNMLVISTPQGKYNIKFSKGRSGRCERKQKEMNLMKEMPEHE